MHRTRTATKTVQDAEGNDIVITTTFHEYTNNCRFCGKELGHLTFEEEERPELNDDLLAAGYPDSRCDECTKEHGTYQDELKAAEDAEILASLTE